MNRRERRAQERANRKFAKKEKRVRLFMKSTSEAKM